MSAALPINMRDAAPAEKRRYSIRRVNLYHGWHRRGRGSVCERMGVKSTRDYLRKLTIVTPPYESRQR